jgi:hypothetical protein
MKIQNLIKFEIWTKFEIEQILIMNKILNLNKLEIWTISIQQIRNFVHIWTKLKFEQIQKFEKSKKISTF